MLFLQARHPKGISLLRIGLTKAKEFGSEALAERSAGTSPG
jgi:hypothetical protein